MNYVGCRHRSRPRSSAGVIERMFERVPLLPLDPIGWASYQATWTRPRQGPGGSGEPWWKGRASRWGRKGEKEGRQGGPAVGVCGLRSLLPSCTAGTAGEALGLRGQVLDDLAPLARGWIGRPFYLERYVDIIIRGPKPA